MQLHDTVRASCPLCFGTRKWSEYDCTTCVDVDEATVRFMLGRLTPKQMACLRWGEHSLGNQPMTEQEWKDVCRLVEFYVEADDGVYDYDTEIVPPTRHWFASGMMSGGGGSPDRHFLKYSALGLALRECLMHGAEGCLGWDSTIDPTAADNITVLRVKEG